ncbi:hypothetical protein B0H14DRAFT_2649995 [Mycena olivaceomarginata]|nr:hypothetical protein B0H14DRAFT_2649995 [Mycena olivaceomarginata]
MYKTDEIPHNSSSRPLKPTLPLERTDGDLRLSRPAGALLPEPGDKHEDEERGEQDLKPVQDVQYCSGEVFEHRVVKRNDVSEEDVPDEPKGGGDEGEKLGGERDLGRDGRGIGHGFGGGGRGRARRCLAPRRTCALLYYPPSQSHTVAPREGEQGLRAESESKHAGLGVGAYSSDLGGLQFNFPEIHLDYIVHDTTQNEEAFGKILSILRLVLALEPQYGHKSLTP